MFRNFKGLRKELYILFIGRLVTNMGSMIFPMLTLILNQKLNLNASTIANYMIIYSLISFPVSLLSGKLADYFNKRNIIVICDLLSVSLYLVCFVIPFSFNTVVILSVASLFQTAEWSSYDTLISDFTLPSQRDKAYSLNYMGANLGLVLAPTIGGLLFKNHLNLCFLINAFSILTSTLLIFFGIKNVSKSYSKEDENKYEEAISDNTSALNYIFNRKTLIYYILFTVLYETVYMQYNCLMPLDLAKTFGEDGAAIFGTYSSLNCLTVVLFTTSITVLLNKKTETKKLLLSSVLVVSGYLIFIIFTSNILIGYLAIVIFTFGEITNTVGSRPFLSKRIPASHRGRITSIITVTSAIVTTLSQKAISSLWDLDSKYAWTLTFMLAFIAMLTLFFLSINDKKEFKDLYKNN